MDEERITIVEQAEETQSAPGSRKSRKKWSLWIYFIIALLVIVIAGYFFLSGKLTGGYQSAQIRQMEKLVNKVQGMESEIQEGQKEIFSLMKDYKEKTGKELPALNLMNLSEEEKVILEDKIKKEEDVSTKSLLNDILEKNNEIDELKAEIRKLEDLLPKPHIVQRGENHFEVAMDFLLNEKGVDKETALKLVERALLFEPLVPGFKVWNFYSGEEYGTFITQGEASISPNEVRRQAKKELVDARDQAISERDKLAEDIKTLETKREELISQLDLLNDEKQKLMGQMSDLNKENQGMQTTINSLFYMLDLEKNLKKQGVLKGGFLRSLKLKKVDSEYFTQSIDLRAGNIIVVSAAALNIGKIRKITLYPGFYREGVDYKYLFGPDKKEAQVIILDTAKLRNERIVISVE